MNTDGGYRRKIYTQTYRPFHGDSQGESPRGWAVDNTRTLFKSSASGPGGNQILLSSANSDRSQPSMDVNNSAGSLTFCQYGNCGGIIVDMSRRGVKVHFDTHHPEVSSPSGDTRTNCEWNSVNPGGACGSGILKTHVVKHVGDVHLRLDACVCPVCQHGFSRPDALRRHLNNPNVMCGGHTTSVQG
ncbi:hypothetical protein C8Q72DRAFT_606761 [Fomitopsis betulina]|nr:hypothetical protein C8Q72DRAFT_606761 [Fomitopsis betulina]